METATKSRLKYVHYGDIHTRKASKIKNVDVLPSIKTGNYITLKTGDLIVADASEDYKDIAIPAILLDDREGIPQVVSGLHTIATRPKKQVHSLFAYVQLFSPKFKHYVYHVGQGLKVFGISKQHFFDYKFDYPSVQEQIKISKTFQLIDDLIASNQRKLEKLQELKKGYLQKMFC